MNVGSSAQKLSVHTTRSLVVSRAGWDEIADFMKKLASKWRELLKMDDAALGLGLAGNPKLTRAQCSAALVRLCRNWLKGQIEAHPDTDARAQLATRKLRADAGMSKASSAARALQEGREKAPRRAGGAPESRPAYLGRVGGRATIDDA